MDKEELYGEIRALLREPQTSTALQPWTYADRDFVPLVRSALRQLRVRGLTVTGAMDGTGEFTENPTEMEGMMIAYYVADHLLSGDLIAKLNDGELGVTFKSGSDLIDTKQAAKSFEKSASLFRDEFQTLLTIALTDGINATSSTFSSQVPQSDEGEVE